MKEYVSLYPWAVLAIGTSMCIINVYHKQQNRTCITLKVSLNYMYSLQLCTYAPVAALGKYERNMQEVTVILMITKMKIMKRRKWYWQLPSLSYCFDVTIGVSNNANDSNFENTFKWKIYKYGHYWYLWFATIIYIKYPNKRSDWKVYDTGTMVIYGTVTTACLHVVQFIRQLKGFLVPCPFQEPKSVVIVRSRDTWMTGDSMCYMYIYTYIYIYRIEIRFVKRLSLDADLGSHAQFQSSRKTLESRSRDIEISPDLAGKIIWTFKTDLGHVCLWHCDNGSVLCYCNWVLQKHQK